MGTVKAVAFDCDGVLADAGSSWAVIHSHFGTGDGTLLSAFLNKEITDEEFMRDDIRQWKEVQPKIHRDELFRCYSGVQLMEGARDVVSALQERGVHVVIISAGVDLFVSTIASMLNVDDWAANGFSYDDEGFLMDEGVCRVPAWNKGEMVEKTNKRLINVFVPTTPNPTSGFLLMFPIDEVIYLNMTFEEASKFIVSAGTSTGKN